MVKSDSDIFSEIGNRVTSLLISRQFYGLYLNMVNKELSANSKQIPTAGVGLQNINYKLFINKRFWGQLEKPQQTSLLVHEALHIMLGHHKSRKNFSNHRRFNEAADLVINHMINKDSFFGKTLPGQHFTKEDWHAKYEPILEDLATKRKEESITEEEFWTEYYKVPVRGVFLEDYPDLSEVDMEAGIPHVYDMLTKIENAKNGNKGMSGSGGQSGDGEESEGDGSGQSGDPTDDTGSSNKGVQKAKELGLPHPIDHTEWKEFDELDPIQQKLVENQSKFILKQVASETMKNGNGIGSIPNALKGIIDRIMNPPKPIRDWQKETRDWLGGFGESTHVKRSYFKPNLILPELPRIKIKHNKHIYLVMDTSGSVGPNLMKQMCMVALNVKRVTEFKITVVECDAYVDPSKGVYELESMSQINRRLEEGLVTGGGGTKLDPAIDFCNERGDITGMMYLTDGHVNAPKIRPIYPFIVVKEENNAKMESWNCPIIEIPANWGN